MATNTIGEVKGKVEHNQQSGGESTKGVTFPLKNVPLHIHDRMKKLQLRVSAEAGKWIDIDQVYIKFLLQKADEIK